MPTLSPGQFQQVPMFMSASDLQASLTESMDRGPGQTMESLWAGKVRGSRRGSRGGRQPVGPGTGGGVYQSIKQHGWQGPGPGLMHVRHYGAIPEFDREELSADDMHHRIAAAADIERKSKGRRTIWVPTDQRTEYPSLTRRQKFGYD